MKLFKTSLLLLALAALGGPALSAQTIESVLRAIQERHMAIEQKNWSASAANNHNFDPGENLYSITPFDWGYGLASYPSDGALSGLTLEQFLAVLNKASQKYDALQHEFVMLPAKHANPAIRWDPGQIYTNRSVSVGTVSLENFREKFLLLAEKVNELKYLEWPAEVTTHVYNFYPYYNGTDPGSPPMLFDTSGVYALGGGYAYDDVQVTTFHGGGISYVPPGDYEEYYVFSGSLSGHGLALRLATGLSSNVGLTGNFHFFSRMLPPQDPGENYVNIAGGTWPEGYEPFTGLRHLYTTAAAGDVIAIGEVDEGEGAPYDIPGVVISGVGWGFGYMAGSVTINGSWVVASRYSARDDLGDPFAKQSEEKIFISDYGLDWLSEEHPEINPFEALTVDGGGGSDYTKDEYHSSAWEVAIGMAAGRSFVVQASEIVHIFEPDFQHTVDIAPSLPVKYARGGGYGELFADHAYQIIALNVGRGLNSFSAGHFGVSRDGAHLHLTGPGLLLRTNSRLSYYSMGAVFLLQALTDVTQFEMFFDDSPATLPEDWWEMGLEWYSAPRPVQIVGRDVTVNVEYVGPFEYELKFYHAAQNTGTYSSGRYAVTGSPFKTVTVTDPDPESTDATYSDSVVGAIGGGYPYSQDPGEAERADKQLLITDGNIRTSLGFEDLSPGHVWTGNITTNATTETPYTNATRQTTTSVIEIPDEEALAPYYRTVQQVSEDAALTLHAELRRMYEGIDLDGSTIFSPKQDLQLYTAKMFDGATERQTRFAGTDVELFYPVGMDGPGWVRFIRNPDGVVTKLIRQLGNNAYDDSDDTGDLDTLAAANYATTFSFSGNTIATVTTRANVTIGKSWQVFSGGGTQVDEYVATSTSATTSGNTSNLRTTRIYYSGNDTSTGAEPWSLKRIAYPDGTATHFTYAFNGTTKQRTVTAHTGVGNATSSVSGGFETVTVTNWQGHLVSQTTTTAGGGATLASATGSNFDGFGRAEDWLFHDGTSISREFFNDGRNLVETETDRLGVTANYTYDVLGRLRGVTRGGVTTTITPNGLTTNATISEITGTFSTTLNGFGEVTAATAIGGINSGVSLTSLSPTAVAGTELGTNRSINRTYHEDGTLIAIADQAVDATTFAYTMTNSMNVPGYGSVTYDGDYLKVTANVTASGALTSSYYDPAGRLVSVARPSPTGSGTVVDEYVYNEKNQLHKIIGPEGLTQVFTYDGLGRMNATVTGVGASPTSGLVTRDISYSGGNQTVTYTGGGQTLTVATVLASAGNRTISLSQGGSTTTASITHNPGSKVVALTSGDLGLSANLTYNGTTLAPTASTTTVAGVVVQSATYGADALGRVLTYSGTAMGQSQSANFRLDGRVQNTTIGGVSTTYGYDGLSFNLNSSLTGTQTYSYSLAGRLEGRSGDFVDDLVITPNLTTSNTTVSFGNQTTVYTGNAAGVGTGKVLPGSTPGQLATYDDAGRVETVTLVNAGASGGNVVATYSYNGTHGLLDGITFSGNTVTTNITYAHNTTTLELSGVTDASGTRALAFERGQLQSANYTAGGLDGFNVAYNYNGSTRQLANVTLTGPGLGGGMVTSYGFAGSSSALEAVSRPDAGSVTLSGNYTYVTTGNSNSTVGLVGYFRQQSGGSDRVVSHRHYDALARVDWQRVIVSNATTELGNVTANMTFGGAGGRRSVVSSTDGTKWVYSYNGSTGKLEGAQKQLTSNSSLVPGYHFAFEYDGFGNREGGLLVSGVGAADNVNDYEADYDGQLNQQTSREQPALAVVRGESPAAVVGAGVAPRIAYPQGRGLAVGPAGAWTLTSSGTAAGGFYLSDNGTAGNKGKAWVAYALAAPPSPNITVRLQWPTVAGAAERVPVWVVVRDAAGAVAAQRLVYVDQSANGGSPQTLASFTGMPVPARVSVRVGNAGTTGGKVAADAASVTAASLPTMTADNPAGMIEEGLATADRTGDYFFLGVAVTGQNSPQLVDTTALADDGSGNKSLTEGERLLGPQVATTGNGTLGFQAGGFGAQLKTWRWDLTWNALGQLIAAETSAAAVSAGDVPRKFEYSYDAEGRRWKQALYLHGAGSPTETTYWVYDGWRPLLEMTMNGTAAPTADTGSANLLRIRKYLWGLDSDGSHGGLGGVGGLVALEARDRAPVGGAWGDWQSLFPKYDALGNVAGLVNPAGEEVATYEYGPYGELLRATGSAKDVCNFRWKTRYTDPVTEFIYFGVRYYDPDTGRWLSREPLGELASANLYAYCNGDPVNAVDRVGMEITSYDPGAPHRPEGVNNLLQNALHPGNDWGPSPYTSVAAILQAPYDSQAVLRDMATYSSRKRYEKTMGKSDMYLLFEKIMESPSPTVRNVGGTLVAMVGLAGEGLVTMTSRQEVEAALDGVSAMHRDNRDSLMASGDSLLAAHWTATVYTFTRGNALLMFRPGEDAYTLQTYTGLDKWARFAGGTASTVSMAIPAMQGLSGPVANLARWAPASSLRISPVVVAESRMTTVLGSMDDVARFANRPGFNVLDMSKVPKVEWSRYNAEWLNQAIARGDNIWLVTDPVKRSAELIRKYGTDQGSAYISLELPMLEQYNGVNVIKHFAPASK